MAQLDNNPPVTPKELLVSSLAKADALVKLLVEKSFYSGEFMEKLSQERGTYQRILQTFKGLH